MPDPGEVIDDPESEPPPAAQARSRGDEGGDRPSTLDAEAILRKLDKRSPGLARSPEPTDLPSSFAGPRSIGGSSPIGSIPGGMGEGAVEPDDREFWLESDRRSIDDALVVGGGRRAEGALIPNPLDGSSTTVDEIGDGATIGGLAAPSILDAGQSLAGNRPGSPAPGENDGGLASSRRVEATPMVPIRVAFPPGLSEDGTGPGKPPGGEWADPSPGGWEPSRGESSGDGMGSRHGVSAEDLLKTNELLRQLIEETKRQRVASLPAAAPRVYPGR